jgi:uncharacterized membrane protein
MPSAQTIANVDVHSGHPAIRKIGTADLVDALRRGFDDFKAMPSHVVFLGLIYPVVGIFFARLAFGYEMLPLVFPLVAGFALVGPVAAIGLYELSRRRALRPARGKSLPPCRGCATTGRWPHRANSRRRAPRP